MTAPVVLVNNGTGTDATSFATAAFTPTANRLVLAAISSSLPGAGTAAPPTLTGNGLTWVLVNNTNFTSGIGGGSANAANCAVFRAMGPSPSNGALTIDFGGVSQTTCVWSVDEFPGIDTSGTNGSGAIVQSVVGASAASMALNLTLAAFSSANNATYGAFNISGPVGANAGTPGGGFTEIYDSGTEWANCEVQWRADNSTAVGITAAIATPGGIGGVAIELRLASAALLNVSNLRRRRRL